jgi:hypothetical protein
LDDFTKAAIFLKNEETPRPWYEENRKETGSSFDDIAPKMKSKMV